MQTLRDSSIYKAIPAQCYRKSKLAKKELLSLMRYFVSQKRMRWYHRGDYDFIIQLKAVRTEFEGRCGLGRDGFWTRMHKRRELTSLLVYWDATFTHWEGFVLIQEEYGCTANRECGPKPDSWFIYLMCTDPGQGIGQKLVDEVKTQAQAQGQKFICAAALANVVGFYHALGFRVTTRANCATTRALDQIPRRRFAGVHEALYSREYRTFLNNVVRAHLGYNELQGDDDCKGVDCAEDGIYMQLCL